MHGIPRLISRRLRGGESLGAFVLSPLDSDGAGPVVAAAARSGVAGVLLYHQQVPELYSAVIPGGTVPVPCVTIRRADALQLEMQPQEVELTVEVEWTDALGVNVVVEVGRRGRPLLFLANYDTRPGAPGAYRNASGVAALLELLARLQSWREHRILVGLLDGEELGGAGSFHCKELLHAMGRLEGLRGVVYVSGLGLRRVCVVAKPPRTRSGLASLTAQCLASEGILAPMRPPRPSPPGVWSCPVVAVTGSPLALEHTALERLNVLHPRHIARAVSALDNLARTF